MQVFLGLAQSYHIAVYGKGKLLHFNNNDSSNMSRDMRFPTMWYVRPAKAQTSLRICPV